MTNIKIQHPKMYYFLKLLKEGKGDLFIPKFEKLELQFWKQIISDTLLQM